MLFSCLFQILSDNIMAASTVLMIAALGINKLRSPKYAAAALGFSSVFSAVLYYLDSKNFDLFTFILYPVVFLIVSRIIFGIVKLSQLYIFVCTEFTVSLLSSNLASILTKAIETEYSGILYFSLFFVRVLLLFIAAGLYRNRKLRHIYVICKTIPKYIFLLIMLALVFTGLLAVFNNYPQYNEIKRIAFSVMIALIMITMIIMVFSLLINTAAKNYSDTMNSLLEKQVEMQINHFEKTEKLNRDIRRFRHDYINHLTAVRALIEQGCSSDAAEYIERLTSSGSCHEVFFNTGNRLADAILTDKSDSCKEFADIDFEGYITDSIENADMCIILANALDNAIEACRKCPERGRISILARCIQGYWSMTMKNPTVAEDCEGGFKTSKEDSLNHGIGLYSIEHTVKKYDGTMSAKIENNVFELSLAMKIKIEDKKATIDK